MNLNPGDIFFFYRQTYTSWFVVLEPVKITVMRDGELNKKIWFNAETRLAMFHDSSPKGNVFRRNFGIWNTIDYILIDGVKIFISEIK